MPYSEAQFDAMQSNPIAIRAYFWRVAMGAHRRFLLAQSEVIERGEVSPTQRFRDVFDADREKRHRAEVDRRLGEIVLANLDACVRSCVERPTPCTACRDQH